MLLKNYLTFLTLYFGVRESLSKEVFSNVISMPAADILESDTYMCYITSVEQLTGTTLIGYDIDSAKHVAHHVTAALVEGYHSDKIYWDCRQQQGHITIGRLVSLGGKDGLDVEHTSMDLGEDIGLPIGGETQLKYLLLQVHYKEPLTVVEFPFPTVNLTVYTTNGRRPFEVQKVLLGSSGYIPANAPMFSSEIATKWEGGSVTIVSYSLHTHNYGLVEEGYLIRDGHAILIGRKEITPHANAVFQLEYPLEMKPGDIIAARCIYNNTETFDVKFGVTNQDEMCNFGINFKYPTGLPDYPKAWMFIQNAQNSTWCSDIVPGTRALCEKPDLPRSGKFNM